jgi:phosphoglycerate dehydrogenase-like enzyme
MKTQNRRSPAVLPRLAASLALMLTAYAAASQSPSAVQSDAERLKKELGLQETPVALRDRPGWLAPRVILVMKPDGHDVEWLRAAAPGVELIAASDMAVAVAAAPRADAVIGFCSAELLDRGKNIRWIQLMSAGVEHCVTTPAVAQRDILVTNMQRVAAPVMAEHVMAMTLSLARELPAYLRQQDEARWSRSTGALALQGKMMLIAGLGGIGTEVARRAQSFGMRIVATDASNRPAPDFVIHVGQPSELLALAREADVIVNTLPLTPATTGVFNAEIFAAMKPRALFINVGRGKTVVTSELVEALKGNRLGGAGLDVTEPEPLPANHPLWRLPNVIVTPHVATDSDLGREHSWQIARENLRRFVAGERMLSVVDVKRGY